MYVYVCVRMCLCLHMCELELTGCHDRHVRDRRQPGVMGLLQCSLRHDLLWVTTAYASRDSETCSSFPFYCRSTGTGSGHYHALLYVPSGSLGEGPQVYTASALSSEVSAQPLETLQSCMFLISIMFTS